jgi:putative methionine-R-sulfoxide reductase with GAF domain
MNYQDAEKVIKTILDKKDENKVQKVIDFLHDAFDYYNWVGIYIVKGGLLHVGPWNGKQATEHVKIPVGQGVCGSAAQTGKTEVVDDVHADSRYLACFVTTRSEIVVPIKQNTTVIGEIDIDSDTPNAFTKKDRIFLEKIADMLKEHIRNL